VLYRNTAAVPQPRSPEEGYHFTADMTDEAIAWTRNTRAADKDKPWFVYYSAAAAHAPHHAPKEWRDKFAGKFDQGWDRQREITFAKQKELGVIPANTKLTPRPKEIPAWDDQAADAKRVYTRLMENYAAYLAYADDQIGRLIGSIEQSGELDNTLIFYIVGDNGPSAEGGLEGTFNEVASLVGFNPGLSAIVNRIDLIGEPESEPHVPVGWAWAMASPLQWTKQIASHFGGTRNPLVVHWPKGIKTKGELRSQFHHVIDIVPTILEAAQVAAPSVVNGIPQKPIEGVSMMYSFDDAKAKGRRTTQYFEMLVNRAIYRDGWVASSRFGVPWNTLGREGDFLKAPWSFTTSTTTSAKLTTLPPRTRRSSKSSRHSSSRRQRNTTCSRSTPDFPSGSTRGIGSLASLGPAGRTSGTTCACRSLSALPSIRTRTRSQPN
jgi:arylsulfatase